MGAREGGGSLTAYYQLLHYEKCARLRFLEVLERTHSKYQLHKMCHFSFIFPPRGKVEGERIQVFYKKPNVELLTNYVTCVTRVVVLRLRRLP